MSFSRSTGAATFAGNITAGANNITAAQYYVQGTYPRIYLSDTNSNDDYSIINDNGTFIVYNDTDSSTAFAIAGDNNVTFSGDVKVAALKKLYFDARQPINDEIRKQENANKNKKEALIIKVNDINHEDNQLNINEFKKLKEEWEKIGPSGRSVERKLWSEFNKNADRFFAEKKQKINDNINEIIALNEQLNKGILTPSEARESLKAFEDIKNTKEYKKITSDIKEQINKFKLKQKNEKINSYRNIFNILIKKDTIENAPSIFIKSINKSYENKKSDMEKLQYACVKLEIISALDSLKKDKDLRDKIQLELLTNKFNKSELTPNDTESLINYFIENFSNQDNGTAQQNLWKRINKCIEVIL